MLLVQFGGGRGHQRASLHAHLRHGVGGGATGGGVMWKGPRDGRREALRREELLSELEPFWGERCRSLRHELHTTGVDRVRLRIIADHDAGRRAEMPKLIGCVEDDKRVAAVELIQHQIAVQLGMEQGNGHGLVVSLQVPNVRDGRTLAGAATVAVASRVALPMFAVAAVVVESERVGGVEETGRRGEGGRLGLCGGRLARVGEGLVER